MIKVETVLTNTFDQLVSQLSNQLAYIASVHGDDSVISVSHSAPIDNSLKFKAIIVYKTP